TATDDCGVATVEFNEVTTQGSCPGSFIIERIWTAIDTGGNQTAHRQLITAEDNTAPIFSEDLPTEVFASCDAIPEIPNVIATDDCSQDVSIVFNEYEEQSNSNQCGSQYN